MNSHVERVDCAQVVVPCTDLEAAIAFYTDQLGFRLDMIMPADDPRVALVSRAGITLSLEVVEGITATDAPVTLRFFGSAEQWPAFTSRTLHAPGGVRIELADRDAPVALPEGTRKFVVGRAGTDNAWVAGRAGMHYRDLIPGLAGSRFIASQIRIPDGGPVPDYVHYHKLRFQTIYCRRGWVRVVYEDQGAPFVLQAGDCVLQPPTIRHRVIEASAGLEVIEISCPAEHETWRDHALELPTPHLRPERLFGGQRFVRHVAADAAWHPSDDGHFECRDTGISEATDGFAGVRVFRTMPHEDGDERNAKSRVVDGRFVFLMVLDGRMRLAGKAFGTHILEAGDACTIPPGLAHGLDGRGPCEFLEVTLA